MKTALVLLLFLAAETQAATSAGAQPRRAAGVQRSPLREINTAEPAGTVGAIALVGLSVIDGRGGAPLRDAVVVIRGDRIAVVGPRASTSLIPLVVAPKLRPPQPDGPRWQARSRVLQDNASIMRRMRLPEVLSFVKQLIG